MEENYAQQSSPPIRFPRVLDPEKERGFSCTSPREKNLHANRESIIVMTGSFRSERLGLLEKRKRRTCAEITIEHPDTLNC